MDECDRCHKGIRGDGGIRCKGVCGRVYHKTKACAAIDEYCLQGLVNCPFLRFMCHDCVTYISNVDDALKQMLDIANSNKINICEQKSEIEELISNHNKEIAALLANNDKEIKRVVDNIKKVNREKDELIKRVEKLCTVNKEHFEKSAESLSKQREEIIQEL
ncbi:PREDICTED: uncharacterized protein LOC108358003 [Rhagoletis zephyria]|uniref:uncharacterized protein LOC108358003 n=1 Tax=Rhagoletis zephyria TaxID=28612 RepID=UPI000811576D|nr:PREDICTED: uncharacterized protein LOC108358003 [Rhagoletis zephyria]